jgi:hypothetical protein
MDALVRRSRLTIDHRFTVAQSLTINLVDTRVKSIYQ